MPNRYEEAAEILRGLKDDVGRLQEERSPDGPVNIFRGVTDSTLSTDTVATSVDDDAAFTWDSDRWDHTEWGE